MGKQLRRLLATCSVLGLVTAPALAQNILVDPAPASGTVTVPVGTGAVLVTQSSFTGTIVNPAQLPFPLAGSFLDTTGTAIAARSKTFTGSVVNLGTLTADTLLNGVTPAAMARANAIGIGIGPTANGGSGGTLVGGVTNSGLIEAIGEANHNLDRSNNCPANGNCFAPGIGIEIQTTVTGSVVNTGVGGFANAIVAFPLTGDGFFFAGNGSNIGIDVHAPVLNGITNAGFITGTNIIAIRTTASIPGGITNTGYIGSNVFNIRSATAFGISASGPLQGGISNSGVIFAGTPLSTVAIPGLGVAIDLSQVTTPTTITQSGGQILGAINFSSNADRLLISGGGVGGGLLAPPGSGAGVTLSGGVLAFGPNFIGLSGEGVQSASGLAFLTQTGGTIVLQVNNSAVAGTFPTISAGNITLTSVAAAGQTGAFAAGADLTFAKIITAAGSLTDNAPANLPVFDFFSTAITAKLVPDGANSLDLVLSNTGGVALTPGVADGIAFTGTFNNPAGVSLSTISVSDGAAITGVIENGGVAISGIGIRNSTLTGTLINTGIVAGGIAVTGLVTGNGVIPGGITNTGLVVPGQSVAPQAVLQPGVPVFEPSTFSPNNSRPTDIRVTAAPSFTGNIVNSGFLIGGNGITLDGGPFVGGVTNSGQIFSGGGSLTFASLVEFIAGTPVSGASPGVEALGLRVGSGPLAGGIVNTGDIELTGNGITVGNFSDFGLEGAVGIAVVGAVGDGVGLNTGDLTGVNTAARATIVGDIVNTGTISVSAFHQPLAIGIDVAATGLFTGNVRNSGTISALGFGAAPGAATVTQAQINQATADNGGVINPVIAMLEAEVTTGRAVGIQIGATAFNSGVAGPFKGAVVNSGLISASGFGVSTTFNGTAAVSGDGIAANVPVLGGITNIGTIMGSTAAIDLRQETGGATTITQAGGALIGSILGPNVANGDILNVTGGNVLLSAGNQIAGIGTVNQTGGTLTLQVTTNTAPGAFPTINAGAINLHGSLVVNLQGNPTTFTSSETTFKDVFVSGSPITGVESVKSSIALFGTTLVPDAATPNALDLDVAFSPASAALTAQVLAQALRFGMDDQQIVVDTLESRLLVGQHTQGPGVVLASVGGELRASTSADQPAQMSAGGTGLGAQTWGRVYGEFGSAGANSGLPAFSDHSEDVIAGVDWHVDQFVVGVAGRYANTAAQFADGSRASLDTYQGEVYGGWRGGTAYVTAFAGGGANDYMINRNLTPFGLTGFATSAPRGALVTAFGEAGYGFAVGSPWGLLQLTPYLNLDYVYQNAGTFAETGGFGSFNVSMATGDSLQATLGARASTRIDLGSYGTLVPEIRAGWAHEFLDASQSLAAQLTGTAVLPFTVVGASFGRDSAVVGAGVAHEFTPGASFFIDYDGKFTGGFNQNAVSAGIKIKI